MTEESRTNTSIILTDDDRTPQTSIDPHLLIPEGVYRLETSNTLVSSTRQRRQVRWTEDTIDNEHLNHRKSNVCCIFHRDNSSDTEDGNNEEDSKGKQRWNAYEPF